MNEELDIRKAYERALFHGCGFSNEDLTKLKIAIVNSWSEINPGHIHLRDLASVIKESVKENEQHPWNLIPLVLVMGSQILETILNTYYHPEKLLLILLNVQ